MTQAAIAAKVHQTLDVHRDFATQVTLDLVITVDRFADLQNLGVGQFVDPALARQANGLTDFLLLHPADAVDVGQCDLDPLVGRDVHASNTRHAFFSSNHTSRPSSEE